MQDIKQLPKDFMYWVDKEGMTDSRYIYYRYSNRKCMDGYCTQCEQEIKVSGVKHRSIGCCPNCGTMVTFLAEGRAKRIADWDTVAYFQKTKKGFVVRYFDVYKRYWEEYRNPTIRLLEFKHDFYEENEVDIYASHLNDLT